MVNKKVLWTCPHCEYHHVWFWDEEDVFHGEVNMKCDGCHKQSKQFMYIAPVSGNGLCESVKEPVMSELEQLKKQVEKLQQRIEELEEEKKQDEYTSLHNVIAKWEFYFSERIEKRKIASHSQINITFRDILEDEVENLLKSIDEWIDKELSFNQTTYTPEYFIGWDECRKMFKKKLRSNCDLYGKTK